MQHWKAHYKDALHDADTMMIMGLCYVFAATKTIA